MKKLSKTPSDAGASGTGVTMPEHGNEENIYF
jgi:hypothetical protein